MYGLSPLKTYCDERDGDWRRYSDGGTDLDFAFYSGLCEDSP